MKNDMRRFLSLVLALVLVAGLLSTSAPTVFAEGDESENPFDVELGLESLDQVAFGVVTNEAFAGKKVSILGDSISTYIDVSNNPSYNSTIGNNAVYYKGTGSMTLEDTWWYQLIELLDMELCVNNSWSGSCILTKRSSTVGAYAGRCVQLHNDNTKEEPDVILVFMGTNDFSYYSQGEDDTWGSLDDVDYSSLYSVGENGVYTYVTPKTVYEAYAIMLHKMQNRYPDAEVYCMGLMARRDPDYEDEFADVGQPTAHNESIKALVKDFGYTYIDLESCIPSTAEQFDLYMSDHRVHPNRAGMDQMTKAVAEGMLKEKDVAYKIDSTLSNVTSSNKDTFILHGNPYETTLNLATGKNYLNVTVSMNGEDITDSCYSDGKIYIPKVTGELQIYAKGFQSFENAVAGIKDNTDITLFANASIDELFLTNNVTLSLNGYTLTANFVSADNGSHILDQTNGQGALIVEKENLILPLDNAHLPIWNGSNGYVFAGIENYRQAVDTRTAGINKLYFLPELPETVHKYLTAGEETSGVELIVELSWKLDGVADSKPFSYGKELIEKFYSGYADGKYAYAFTMTVTGIELVDKDSLNFRVYYRSRGVEYELQ